MATVPIKLANKQSVSNEDAATLNILRAADAIAADHPTQSVSIALITMALVQIETTLNKADEGIAQAQAALTNMQNQRVGLQAQKVMLAELKTRLVDVEKFQTKIKENEPSSENNGAEPTSATITG